MKLRDNYRIPNIDEFIDGFEFEVYSAGYFEDDIERFCGWYEYKFGFTNWRNLSEIEELLSKGDIQVYCNLNIGMIF